MLLHPSLYPYGSPLVRFTLTWQSDSGRRPKHMGGLLLERQVPLPRPVFSRSFRYVGHSNRRALHCQTRKFFQMTDCTAGYRAVAHPSKRGRTWIISIIFGAIAIAAASMFGDHPPDPNKCGPELRPTVTQIVSPVNVALGCFESGVDVRRATKW